MTESRLLDPEDEAFNEIERQAKQRMEAVKAAMDKKQIKNPPAFPRHMTIYGQNVQSQSEGYGMDLRDYFAAKALSGLINYSPEPSEHEAIARLCYSLADAMLKAREA